MRRSLAEILQPLSIRGPAWLTNLGLLLFGALLTYLTWSGTQHFHRYVVGFAPGLFGQILIYLGAIALIERSPIDRWTLPVLLLAAVAARVPALVHRPFLSTDIFRYVWDGKVQLAGINPYRYIPADPHLAFLRDGVIYPNINRRSYAHTIYPPAAQMFFLLAARVHASVLGMKLAMLACEAATCAVLIRCLRLLGQPRERVLLYAWHPVCLWEIASSGHVDALAVTLLALAILVRVQGRPISAAAWLGAATLVKLYPAALLPAFLRRRIAVPALTIAAVVIAGYLPYLSVGRGVLGFLPSYAKEEGIDTGVRFFPLDLADRLLRVHVPTAMYIGICALLLGGLAWLASRRSALHDTACIPMGLALATALTLCFSPHYPWYFLWLLPFLTLWPGRPAFFLVLAVTYLLATQYGAPSRNFEMNTRLYGGFVLMLGLDVARRWWSTRKTAASARYSVEERGES